MKEKRYFEWIAGDDIGEVVMLESMTEFDGEIFFNFDNGDVCNKRFISKATNSKGDLKEKFMVEVDSPSNVWTTEKIEAKVYTDQSMQESVDIPTLNDVLQANGNNSEINSNIGKSVLVPPRKSVVSRELPDIKDWIRQEKKIETPKPIVKEKVSKMPSSVETDESDGISESKEIVTVTTEEKRIVKEDNRAACSDPVYIMVKKTKTHSTEIPIVLTIDLPSKSLYRLVSEEFENGSEKFIDYVIDGIDVSSIISSLKESLKVAYEKED